MSTHSIYIYIGNGSPVLFNVDNEADGLALEKLGAIKMPEAMASEVFGENVKYADNTTCIITDNPDNQEFPFTVTFDSSKIPEKPKRNTGTLAGISMPSDKYIELSVTNGSVYTAPANGYLFICGHSSGFTCVELHVLVDGGNIRNNKENLYGSIHSIDIGTGISMATIPVKKGAQAIIVWCTGTVIDTVKFVYAEGEL